MTTTPSEAENPAPAPEVADRARREESERRQVAELRGNLENRLDDLPPALRARFEARLKKRKQVAAAARAPELPRRPAGRAAPLSFAQERLWFIDRFEPGSPAYNMPFILRFPGPLDIASLERSLAELLRRHEILRTVFEPRGGAVAWRGPVQIVQPPSVPPLTVVDLGRLEDGATEVRRWVRREGGRPFDLRRGPLVRCRLLVLADESVLIFNVHHIVFDGWSCGILTRELGQLYHAFSRGCASPLRELPMQYADFAVWQREWLSGERLERQLEYWQERLRGIPVLLELPLDRPRPRMLTYEGSHRTFPLPAGVQEGIRGLTRRPGITPFMVLLASAKALLYRLTGETDLVVGTPVANRDRRELEGLIGLFVNTLVLRTDLSADPTFTTLVDRVRQTTVEAYEHQDLPFERLVEGLLPERSLGHSPLFQVMFLVEEEVGMAAGNAAFPAGGPAPTIEVDWGPVAKFDLTLAFVQRSGALNGLIDYRRDLFDASTILRFCGCWGRLLAAAAANPELRLSELSLLSPAERQQLLAEWAASGDGAAAHRWRDGLIHRLFEARARRSGEAVAMVDAAGRTTYDQLDASADRLARQLRDLGVGPEVAVGLAGERMPAVVVGLLGILKAGGVCLPLDPALPAERRDFILRDAGTRVLLSDTADDPPPPPPAAPPWRRVRLEDARAPARRSGEDPGTAVSPGNLAYVVYTSGSTGTPKGVGVTHGQALPILRWGVDYLGLGPSTRVLQNLAYWFDFGLFELWTTLLAGGTLVFPEERIDFRRHGELIATQRIDTVHSTPSFFRELLAQVGNLGSLRRVHLGGEALSRSLLCRIEPAVAEDCRVMNGYGPTETSINCSIFACSGHPLDRGLRGATVPIGRVTAHHLLYVLDRSGRPLPLGIAGELAVGGGGVARGYLGRPALTASRFVPDPFAEVPGSRLYRSGDLVRYLARGELEFLGRVDHQVKIRGLRIELGEIEAVLAAHPQVREAVAVVHRDEGGEPRLVAFVVPEETAAAMASPSTLAAQLRGFLAGRLTSYMVPSAIAVLEALPITANGKVDRAALVRRAGPLHRPRDAEAAGAGEDPKTPIEERLAGIFSEILGRERIGRHDDFFDLGGHSLLATRAISRVEESFGVELPLKSIFEQPTVAGLAERVDAACRETWGSRLPPIVAAPRDRDLPLSFAQERLWFIDRLEPGSPAYNIPLVTRFRGPLDIASLERSLAALLRRHEVLRTVFDLAEEGPAWRGPVQRVQPPAEAPLPVVDLRRLADGEAEVARRLREEGQRAFDLQRGPLVRYRLFALGGEHVLIWNVHHIVFDGWSAGILFRELRQLYGAFSRNHPSPLAELPIQYADFALWQRQWLSGERLERQLAWWRERLRDIPPALELPTDRPHPATVAMEGAEQFFPLPAAVGAGIRRMTRGSATTPFMVLLASAKALLCRLTGETDLVVGTAIANRNHSAIEGLIGFFVNTLVLRTDLSSDPSFSAVVARVRETTVGAYDHQDLPFEKLVEELQPERDLSQTPFFQVSFAFEEAAQPAGEADLGAGAGITIDNAVAAPVAKFDLTLAFFERAGELEAVIEYRTSLFDATTIRRWGGYLVRLLAAAVKEPGRRLSELPLLAAAERQQLLSEWNDTRIHRRGTALVPELFFRQARRSGDAVAVEHGARRLTYGELARRSERLADVLRRQGVAPGTVVGLCMDHGPELITALFGILAAGGAYLPLELTLPAARLSYMLDDAGVSVVVADRTSAASLPATKARLLHPDDDAPAIAAGAAIAAGEPARPLRADDPAYLIYTSGSTGAPKAVVVEHGNLRSTVEASRRAFGGSAADRMPCTAPFSFDIFLFELLSPLLAGGTAVLFSPRPTLDLAAVVDSLGEMTRFHAVPAVMRQAVDAVRLRGEGADRFAGLRSLFVGGDRVPADLLEDLRPAFPSAQVWVLYGPTEATIICSHHRVEGRDPRPLLGRPLADVELRLADRHGQPVPIGVAGEIYIGGPCVTRGYLNREELTAEKYPLVEGRRFFRSGDLGRFLPDGNLEFLGRIDHQVKVRGQRIELGEIEAVLARQPAISQAVVLARRDPSSGGERLVAYVVSSGDEAPRSEALEEALAEVLPDYMVPRVFVVLEALPLTANGKVDRAALGQLMPEGTAEEAAQAPRDRLELSLSRIWEELLGRGPIGIREDFFAAGGHSLLVSRLQLRIESLCGWRPPVASLFRHPTIEKQAALLRRPDAAPRDGAGGSLVPIRSSGSRPPLFCVHPGSGHVACYHALARHLGSEQPFFAFQSPSLEGGDGGPETIEGMAAAYLGELCAVQTEGPYHLAGWSMGGLVALEMARQLLEAGREVALVALLDARAPEGSDHEVDEIGLLAAFALHLGIPLERLPPLSEVELRDSSWQPLAALHQLAQDLGALPPDLGEEDLERFWSVFRRNAEAVRRHVPRSYPRRAFLLTAEEEAADLAQDPTLGWSQLVADLAIRAVPGGHFTMVDEPHVEQLARVLSTLMGECSG